MITKEYISFGEPVGSSHLISKFNLNVSPATVRNEMAELEKKLYLSKSHTSSGRIPSAKGFEFYANTIKGVDVEKNIKNKLKQIFAKRTLGIDSVINEAADAISSITNLTLMTSSDETDAVLKSIQYVPLNATNSTVVLVTSSGRVESKLVEASKYVKLNDVRIAVRMFKDRLVDTPLKDLGKKAASLAPILKEVVKNYEFVLQELMKKVFTFHTKQTSFVHGRTNIIKESEFMKDPTKLLKIMEALEKKSIWQSIESKSKADDETLRIDISADKALISKKIKIDEGSKEISIVGSSRMHYEQALPILDYLDVLIKENDKEK